MKRIDVIFVLAMGLIFPACSQSKKEARKSTPQSYEIQKTEAEWKKILSPIQYNVLWEKGTERAFTGEYWDNHEHGIYSCAACQLPLFSSETKFESGTGWPSFFKPLNDSAVSIITDTSHNMVREEAVCRRCGGHLGHVFDDGPQPTGLRYCLNSAALKFEKEK